MNAGQVTDALSIVILVGSAIVACIAIRMLWMLYKDGV